MFYTILSYPLFLITLEPDSEVPAADFAQALEGPSSRRSSRQPKFRDAELSDSARPGLHLKGSHCHVPKQTEGAFSMKNLQSPWPWQGAPSWASARSATRGGPTHWQSRKLPFSACPWCFSILFVEIEFKSRGYDPLNNFGSELTFGYCIDYC